MNKFPSEHGRLVRPGVIDKLRDEGLTPVVRRIDDDEYEQALGAELVKQAQQVVESDWSIERLADMADVVNAICRVKGINPADIEDIRTIVGQQHGGFGEKCYLERIDE